MIKDIIKKQGLIFLRNPQQLLLLILLPIVLIVILSISLSALINGGESISIDANVAFVEQSDEATQIDTFIKEIETSDIPEEEKISIAQIAQEMNVVEQLRDNVLGEIDDMIQLDVITEETKAKALQGDKYTSVIEVPENFTYDMLTYLFLDGKTPGQLNVYHNTEGNINVAVVNEIIALFQEQLTLTQYAVSHGIDPETVIIHQGEVYGKVAALDDSEPIDSNQYYTIGMAVMNVLFIASAISSFAFMEKEKHIFNRIILSGMDGREYLAGIFLSGVIFGFIQLMVIFGFAWLVFGVSWPNLSYFFYITAALAFAVGGLSVLLTVITYFVNSEAVINFFGSIIVGMFALVGGSFFPIGDLSQIFQAFGEFTPNGAAMAAYLQLLQGDSFTAIVKHIIFLLLFAGSLLLVSTFFFPKRGQIQ